MSQIVKEPTSTYQFWRVFSTTSLGGPAAWNRCYCNFLRGGLAGFKGCWRAWRYGMLLGRTWTNLAEILGHDSGIVWLIVIQISSGYDEVCPSDGQKTAEIDWKSRFCCLTVQAAARTCINRFGWNFRTWQRDGMANCHLNFIGLWQGMSE